MHKATNHASSRIPVTMAAIELRALLPEIGKDASRGIKISNKANPNKRTGETTRIKIMIVYWRLTFNPPS